METVIEYWTADYGGREKRRRSKFAREPAAACAPTRYQAEDCIAPRHDESVKQCLRDHFVLCQFPLLGAVIAVILSFH